MKKICLVGLLGTLGVVAASAQTQTPINKLNSFTCQSLNEQRATSFTQVSQKPLILQMEIYQEKLSRLGDSTSKYKADSMKWSFSTLDQVPVNFATTTETNYVSSITNISKNHEPAEYEKGLTTLVNGISGFIKPTIQDDKIVLDICFNKAYLTKLEDFTYHKDLTIQLPSQKLESLLTQVSVLPNGSQEIPLQEGYVLKVTVKQNPVLAFQSKI